MLPQVCNQSEHGKATLQDKYPRSSTNNLQGGKKKRKRNLQIKSDQRDICVDHIRIKKKKKKGKDNQGNLNTDCKIGNKELLNQC